MTIAMTGFAAKTKFAKLSRRTIEITQSCHKSRNRYIPPSPPSSVRVKFLINVSDARRVIGVVFDALCFDVDLKKRHGAPKKETRKLHGHIGGGGGKSRERWSVKNNQTESG